MFSKDVYPVLVASEESLDAVASAVNKAAQIGPDEPGKVGGIDHERWKRERVPIERCVIHTVHKTLRVQDADDLWFCTGSGRTSS